MQRVRPVAPASCIHAFHHKADVQPGGVALTNVGELADDLTPGEGRRDAAHRE